MLAEPLYPLHARYFVAGDSLRSSTPNWGSYSIAVMYCKVSQRYLIKTSCKKKNID
jgi:hypothetical protein